MGGWLAVSSAEHEVEDTGRPRSRRKLEMSHPDGTYVNAAAEADCNGHFDAMPGLRVLSED